MSSWINGETGGYLRVCTEGRNWFETDFPNWLKEPAPRITPESRSEEHGSYIIEALETGRTYRGHFNIPNRHHITNLQDDCVVEIPGYVDRTGINSPVIGDLPCPAPPHARQACGCRRWESRRPSMAMFFCSSKRCSTIRLVGAVCNPEEIWQMTDEMLVAQAQWLPQFKHAIQDAKDRLSTHDRKGTRVKLSKTQGAARLKTKTVEEMALRLPKRGPMRRRPTKER